MFKNSTWVVNYKGDKDQGVEVVAQGFAILNQEFCVRFLIT